MKSQQQTAVDDSPSKSVSTQQQIQRFEHCYNCRGNKNSKVDIKKLCETYNIIFLQETWITKQNLDFLSTISDHHDSFGYSPINECDELRKGSPYGGTARLWKKELPAKSIVSHSG